MRETDDWLQSTQSILEASVILSVHTNATVPFDLINTEEIDKTMILADSLRSKITE